MEVLYFTKHFNVYIEIIFLKNSSVAKLELNLKSFSIKC